MKPNQSKKQIYLKIIYYLAVLLLLGMASWALIQQTSNLKPNDFLEYWSSARLTLTGGNPYDPIQLHVLQKQAGLSSDAPIIMYNPPWVIPLLIPFGIFDRETSQMIWLLFQITIILFCSLRLWEIYFGVAKYRWLPIIAGFIFAPIFSAIVWVGQISPLFLLGVTGFLIFIDRPKHAWIAGGFAAIAAIKPQVPYILFLMLLITSLFNRRLSLVAGFITTLLVLTGISMLFSPQILIQYLNLFTQDTPALWATPTIGAFIRTLGNQKSFWIQYIPSIIGAAWCCFYWYTHRKFWNWRLELPILLFISTITSAYTWTYDQVLLLVPILHGFAMLMKLNLPWFTLTTSAFYVIINYQFLRLHIRYDDFWFIWFAPMLFIWYLIIRTRYTHPQNYLFSEHELAKS